MLLWLLILFEARVVLRSHMRRREAEHDQD